MPLFSLSRLTYTITASDALRRLSSERPAASWAAVIVSRSTTAALTLLLPRWTTSPPR
jgi:hypothetical protein